jgi:high-affinity K+ transport system ATPase subunit B
VRAGINASPALAGANIGITARSGADVARENAYVAFLEGKLWKIPQAIDIARESISLIRLSAKTRSSSPIRNSRPSFVWRSLRVVAAVYRHFTYK